MSLTALSLTLFVTATCAAVISPLTFWTDGNTGVSYLYNSKSTADALTSQAKCAAQGGSLLSLQSQADIDASAYSQAMQVNPSGALYWTGLQIIITEKVAGKTSGPFNGAIFQWSDGSSTSFISKQTANMNLVPGCRIAPTGNTTCCAGRGL